MKDFGELKLYFWKHMMKPLQVSGSPMCTTWADEQHMQ